VKATRELTIRDIAKEAKRHFKVGTRYNGSKFIYYHDITPQWIRNMVSEAGRYKLADDYIYYWVDSALSSIVNGMTERNISAYINTDWDAERCISDLTMWLNSGTKRVCYLTKALEESGETDGCRALALAQYKEIEEIFVSVLNSVRERLNKMQSNNNR